MSGPRVRYAEAPEFVLHYPTCSACDVELEHDGDAWECPKCATTWDSQAGDGDKGELYEHWSGESLDQPTISHDEGASAPWIEHPYNRWLTASGLDMGRCHKCYQPESLHIGADA